MVIDFPYLNFASQMRNKLSHVCTWDRLGIIASGFCLVHCILLSLLIAAFPLSLAHFADHTHLFLFLLVVPVAAYSLVRGYLRHRKIHVLSAGIIGVLLLYSSLLIHGSFGGESLEHGIAAMGSILLILAHFKNQKPCSHDL